MSKIIKRITIGWLENNQETGAFDGHMEQDMDFESLSDDEIAWYFDNWVLDNIDVEDYDDDEQEEIVQYLRDFS